MIDHGLGQVPALKYDPIGKEFLTGGEVLGVFGLTYHHRCPLFTEIITDDVSSVSALEHVSRYTSFGHLS